MPRCKAPEIPRNEEYLEVRRNDEGWGKRSRWAFFSSLLDHETERFEVLSMEKDSVAILVEGTAVMPWQRTLLWPDLKLICSNSPSSPSLSKKFYGQNRFRSTGYRWTESPNWTSQRPIFNSIKERRSSLWSPLRSAINHRRTLCSFCPGRTNHRAHARFRREPWIHKHLQAEKNEERDYLRRKLYPPHGARLKGPGHVSVLLNAVMLPTGVFPSKKTADTIPRLRRYYPVIHPARMFWRQLSITESHRPSGRYPAQCGTDWTFTGEFYLYVEGMTPAVARAYESLNQERLSICKALAINFIIGTTWNSKITIWARRKRNADTDPEYQHGCRFRQRWNLCGNQNERSRVLKGPLCDRRRSLRNGSPRHPGRPSSSSHPTHDAVIQLASIINRTDYWKTGRGIKQLGLSKLDKKGLKKFLLEEEGKFLSDLF